jgi:Lon protease-like protein
VASIGLFPLAIVLLPSERTALHIFEPRYKELIGECLLEDREFGIVFTDGARLSEVGTAASIVEVLERFDDGRLNIVVEGNGRFRIEGLSEERSFITAEIDDVDDEVEIIDEEITEQCLADYRRVVQLRELDLEEPVPDYRGLAFHLASRLALPPEAKQELLEMRSENRRLARVREFLAAAVAAAQVRVIQRRAATNGQVERA